MRFNIVVRRTRCNHVSQVLSHIIFNSSEIKKCCEEAINSLGGLNYLIHCAGNYNKASADECDLEVWDDILDANLRSTYHFARHLLPQINKAPGGAVIRINSRDAPHTGIGIQTAQKRAIDGYMEVLFEDVREYGMDVLSVIWISSIDIIGGRSIGFFADRKSVV